MSNQTFLTSVEEKYEEDNAFDNDDENNIVGEEADNEGKYDIVNDIMMILDMDKVFDLQLEFQKAQNGLTIYEFIFVMNRFLDSAIKNNDDATSKKLSKMKETEKVSALSELFAQIDINGDGTMEWEEFTSYIVESGLNASTEGPTAIQRYQPAKLWEDTSKHKQEIEKMYFFPKTRTIGAIEGNSPVLKLYNTSCHPLNELKAPSGNVLCAEHIPELRQYVMTSSDLSLSFFDDSSMRLHKSFHSPVSQMCMTWNAQSRTLYSAGVSGAIYAWDPEKMEEKYHLGGPGRDNRIVKDSHRDMVLCLKSFPTLETLASASMDRTIRLWDTQTGRHRRKLEGHEKGVRSLAYNSDHRFMVSGGFDYDALVWNPYVERLILRLHGHNAPLVGVEMVPNTPQIVTGDASGVVKIWDIRTFTCMQTFLHDDTGGNTAMNAFVCLPQEQRIITGSRKLRKFDYQKLQNPDLSSDLPVVSATYNDKLMSFITVTPESVQIWDTKGNLTQTFRDLSEKGVTTCALDDRDRKFILGDYDGNIKVYDYLSGVYMKKCNYREFNDRAHDGEISNIQYVNKYKCFISTSWDRAISIHDENDAEGGILLRRIDNAHDTDISALDYNSHMSMIVSGDSDGVIRYWDYEFVRPLGICNGHAGGIRHIEFLGNYPIIVSSDTKGLICLWGTGPNAKFKGVCLARNKNLEHLSQHNAVSVGVFKVEVEWSEPLVQLNSAEKRYHEMKVLVRKKVMSKSKHLRELFRQIGGDGDGKIDMQEFKSAMLNFGVGIGKQDLLEQLFHDIDDDSSGQITYDEFHDGLTHLTENVMDSDDDEDNEDGIAPDGSDGRYVIGAKLYTGDDHGRVKIYDLLPIVKELQENHDLFVIRKSKKCENPKRSLRWDAKAKGSSSSSSNNNSRSNSSSSNSKTKNRKNDGPKPLLSNTIVEMGLIHSWAAHPGDGGVLDLKLIRNPKSMITSGNDRLVKIWNRDGMHLGTLHQGHNFTGIGWHFKVDLDANRKRKLMEAKEIINTINDMVEDEERKRLEGDADLLNPIFNQNINTTNVPALDLQEQGSDLDAAALKAYEEHRRRQMMGEDDAVNLHIEDIKETSERLISELSNLSIRERNSRIGGIAAKVRKTPRLRPVDPKHAGRGYSITPRGREFRAAGLKQFKKK